MRNDWRRSWPSPDLTAIQGAGTAIEPLGIVTDPAVSFLPPQPVAYDLLVDLTTELARKSAARLARLGLPGRLSAACC